MTICDDEDCRSSLPPVVLSALERITRHIIGQSFTSTSVYRAFVSCKLRGRNTAPTAGLQIRTMRAMSRLPRREMIWSSTYMVNRSTRVSCDGDGEHALPELLYIRYLLLKVSPCSYLTTPSCSAAMSCARSAPAASATLCASDTLPAIVSTSDRKDSRASWPVL